MYLWRQATKPLHLRLLILWKPSKKLRRLRFSLEANKKLDIAGQYAHTLRENSNLKWSSRSRQKEIRLSFSKVICFVGLDSGVQSIALNKMDMKWGGQMEVCISINLDWLKWNLKEINLLRVSVKLIRICSIKQRKWEIEANLKYLLAVLKDNITQDNVSELVI